MGNLLSVQKALEYLGEDAAVISNPKKLREAERIMLPGVGAFPNAMANLESRGWIEVLHYEVQEKKKPFLGICLGMQLLAEYGDENGRCAGLGWLNAEVKRFSFNTRDLKIPHVGWNEIRPVKISPLLHGVKYGTTFYFVHSYHMVCDDISDIAALCDYGGEFAAVVQKDNIFATQFHPEKSQDNGLKILENFVEWKCR